MHSQATACSVGGAALTLGSFLPPLTSLPPNTMNKPAEGLPQTLPPTSQPMFALPHKEVGDSSPHLVLCEIRLLPSCDELHGQTLCCSSLRTCLPCSRQVSLDISGISVVHFQCSHVLCPYFYISFIVLVWIRKKRVTCLYLCFCLDLGLTEPHSSEPRPRRVYQAGGVGLAKAQGLERVGYVEDTMGD